MTTDRMLEILDQYDRNLYVQAAPVSEAAGGTRLQHVRWMCQQVPAFIDAGKLEKAHRWLGFIQGALWHDGFYTIEEMKEHNK